MKSWLVARAAIGFATVFAVPGVALAQMIPGAEIVGQPMQVTTNGVTNTVYLDPGGTARIITPNGNTVPANWTAASGQLCLNTGAAQECWPYTSPFRAGQPVTLTSSCNAASTWLAQSTNPMQGQRGERGR